MVRESDFRKSGTFIEGIFANGFQTIAKRNRRYISHFVESVLADSGYTIADDISSNLAAEGVAYRIIAFKHLSPEGIGIAGNGS